MKYEKPPLSFEDQADRAALISLLSTVNYYRLSGYLYPFRLFHSDDFAPGTTIDEVLREYTFDRELRLVTMDAIERVEVAVRTQLAYHFAMKNGPFGYLDAMNLPDLELEVHKQWLADLATETDRTQATCIEHFKLKYGDAHQQLPIWMLIEVMSFGKTYTFFNGVSPEIRSTMAAEYKVPDVVLRSWLGALNGVRNICAHHGRLWNRDLGFKPMIPRARKFPDWHIPVPIPPDRVFAISTILRYMLSRIAPACGWDSKLANLLNGKPTVSKNSMGFPDSWEESPLWMDFFKKPKEDSNG